MSEVTLTTNKVTAALGESINVWRWEVPVYLFLGGLTAGILIIAAYMILKDKNEKYPVATNKIILLAPIIISLGMFALFLDLEHKLYFWRFYTAFKITSVMSWGAWILVFVYPASILLILGTFRKGYPVLYSKLEALMNKKPLNRFKNIFQWIFDFSEKHKKTAAKATIPIGILLGVYTGVLLSSLGARPFWYSAIMGPLFLVSGASTGAALIVLLSKDKVEREFFTKLDIGLIFTEFIILSLFIIGLVTSSAAHANAAHLILGGKMTHIFWIFIMGFGLSIPVFLEILELRGYHIPPALAASMVLIGGLLLRFIFVEAGQISTLMTY